MALIQDNSQVKAVFFLIVLGQNRVRRAAEKQKEKKNKKAAGPTAESTRSTPTKEEEPDEEEEMNPDELPENIDGELWDECEDEEEEE